jgi:5-methylcytosine-specific restriction endonuclease McrBC regulatory subunit McrC
MAAEAMASSTTSGAAVGDPAASTCPTAGAPPSPPRMMTGTTSMGADDNAIEEPEDIMRHPGLRAPEIVSLSEVMGTTHFALNQVHDVLRREREDINEERVHLLVWLSLLKQRTTSKKERAEVRQKRLDVMEVLYSRR